MTCKPCTQAAAKLPATHPVYNLACPHCAARLLLSGWALPAQRKALWAAIARRPGAPAKSVVQELVKTARP
jgi:hypothetical protein